MAEKILTLSDTIQSFNCCVRMPPNCIACPICEHPEWVDDEEKQWFSRHECKQAVKDSVDYWLHKAKDGEANG